MQPCLGPDAGCWRGRCLCAAVPEPLVKLPLTAALLPRSMEHAQLHNTAGFQASTVQHRALRDRPADTLGAAGALHPNSNSLCTGCLMRAAVTGAGCSPAGFPREFTKAMMAGQYCCAATSYVSMWCACTRMHKSAPPQLWDEDSQDVYLTPTPNSSEALWRATLCVRHWQSRMQASSFLRSNNEHADQSHLFALL